MTHNSTSRNILKRIENTSSNRYLSMNVHCSIILNSQKVETTQIPSSDELINKMWYVHSMEHFSAMRRNGVLIHATKWMNPENILSERNQTQGRTNIV